MLEDFFNCGNGFSAGFKNGFGVLFVRFSDKKAYEGGLSLLEEALKIYPGSEKCVVFSQAEKQLKVLEMTVNISEDLLNSLYVMFGRDNIAVK